MPSRHRYRCQNPNCPSLIRACRALTFVAMNSPMPACPQCGSVKVDDWGPAVEVGAQTDGMTAGTDANLRRIADRYDLTDMNNAGGQAVKRAPPAAAPVAMASVGGIPVPVTGTAECVRVPMKTQPITGLAAAPNPNSSPMLKQNTRVVANHKGRA